MKFKLDSNIWKDAVTVIVIAVIPAFIAYPFNKSLPSTLTVILGYYTTTLGYLWLCCSANKVETKHLAVVAGLVWIITMTAYTLMFWNQVGSKFTFRGIIWGGFLHETISVIVGSLLYVVGRALKYYFKHYIKREA